MDYEFLSDLLGVMSLTATTLVVLWLPALLHG